ncbi:3'-5' exonuclease [Cryptosporangium sp. NPDC048952]|uniref:3'-5' exonuclease n=1 Tax=Cryptosporangium sp. NPDC048952 TaxID=3363961 RepID=UPI00371365E1
MAEYLPWYAEPLAAVDLEGTGAQDGAGEAILEIAVVPFVGPAPNVNEAYSTLVNLDRPVPRRPWISPGLTDTTLATAPRWNSIAGIVAGMLEGRWIVGHNVGVDWILLSRRIPGLRAAGLIDTLRLSRAAGLPGPVGLEHVVNALGLGQAVREVVPVGQPHRALWDATAAALLLPALVTRVCPNQSPTIAQLVARSDAGRPQEAPVQDALF